MSSILIERVLLGHLERRGMRRGDIALLVRAARTSTTAHRLLAGVTGADVTTTVPSPVGADGRPVPDWTGEPVAVATIPLSGNYGWAAGELLDPKGTVPQSLAIAAIGRPSGSLFEHRDVDPGAVLAPPARTGGVAAVPIEAIPVRVPPFPAGRTGLAIALLRQRRREKPSGNGVTLTFSLASLLILAATATRIAVQPHDALTLIGTATMALTWLTVTFLAVDSFTGRLLSETLMRRRTTHESLAASAHREAMLARQQERGFDDEGRRIP